MNHSKFELEDLGLLCPQAVPHDSRTVGDLVREAFESPIDYPPLSQSIVAGDKVAIALQPDVPQGIEVAEAVIDYLLAIGLTPDDVSLVVPKRMNIPARDDQEFSPRSKIRLHVHDPEDELAVSYLAANVDGDPVKISGILFDADVIIPIACVDSPAYSRLYPEFSSADTIRRIKDVERKRPNESESETRLANEHLGLFTALNVVGAPGNSIQNIKFGTRDTADRAARELADEVWQIDPFNEADMVIATIESVDPQHVWSQFSKAIVHAARLSPNDAPIVLIADISDRPGDKMSEALQLQFEADDEALYRRLKKYDKQTRELVQTLRERRVFAWLDLDEEMSDELGLGFIDNRKQLERLLEGFPHKVLVRDADRITINAAQPAG